MKKVTADYPTSAMKELFEAILRLKSTDEASKFSAIFLRLQNLKNFPTAGRQ